MKFPSIKLPTAVTRAFWTAVRKTGKRKPEICLVAGFIAGGAAIVFTAVETWKHKDTLKKDADQIKYLREYDAEKESEKNPEAALISEEDRVKQLREAYLTMGKDIFVAYWKPILSGTTSMILIVTSHRSIRRQLGEMAVAYTTLLNAYRKYRENVVADIGIEKDQEYAHGVKMEERVDEETGEVRKVPVMKGMKSLSPYARWLDEGDFDAITGRWIRKNNLFTENRRELEVRLRTIQNELNDMLTLRGFLFLNDAYIKLGLPMTKEGWHVGWVKGDGDNFVDFGIFPDYANGKFQLPVNKSFLDYSSGQRYPLIDFNVDGCIDYIFDDINEYDNISLVAYDKRRHKCFGGSKEYLDRWFRHNELVGAD